MLTVHQKSISFCSHHKTWYFLGKRAENKTFDDVRSLFDQEKRGQKNKGTLQHFFVSFLVLKESKVASLKKRTFGKWYIGSYDHQKLWKTLVQMVLLKVLEINLKHKLHFCALHDMKLYSLPLFLFSFWSSDKESSSD